MITFFAFWEWGISGGAMGSELSDQFDHSWYTLITNINWPRNLRRKFWVHKLPVTSMCLRYGFWELDKINIEF